MSKFVCLLAAILCLISFDCTIAPAYAYDIVIDPRLSPNHQADCLTAIQSWEKLLDGDFVVKSISYTDCNQVNTNQICIHASTEAYIQSQASPSNAGYGDGDIDGFTHRDYFLDSSNIYLASDRIAEWGDPDPVVVTIVAHELGHALGLQHTQKGTVMAYLIGLDAPLPTCDDFAQWANIRGLPDKNRSCPEGGHFALSGK